MQSRRGGGDCRRQTNAAHGGCPNSQSSTSVRKPRAPSMKKNHGGRRGAEQHEEGDTNMKDDGTKEERRRRRMITVMMMGVMTYFALPRRSVSQGCAAALAVSNQPCNARCREKTISSSPLPLRGCAENCVEARKNVAGNARGCAGTAQECSGTAQESAGRAGPAKSLGNSKPRGPKMSHARQL